MTWTCVRERKKESRKATPGIVRRQRAIGQQPLFVPIPPSFAEGRLMAMLHPAFACDIRTSLRVSLLAKPARTAGVDLSMFRAFGHFEVLSGQWLCRAVFAPRRGHIGSPTLDLFAAIPVG